MDMNNRIKETFDMVHAEEELKNNTRKYIADKSTQYHRRKKMLSRRVAPALACFSLLLFCLAGYWIYFTPTSVISIDINPSFELDINRFDRVISVQPYNEDGYPFETSADVRFMNYKDALNKILYDEKISELLAQGEILSVVVIEADERQRDEMLSNVEACTSGHENTFCYSVHSSDVAEAHGCGLSYGKYCAFLEVQEFDPDITAEEIRGMTMKEIRNLICDLSSDSSCHIPDGDGTEEGQGGSNAGEGAGNGHGNKHHNGHHGN